MFPTYYLYQFLIFFVFIVISLSYRYFKRKRGMKLEDGPLLSSTEMLDSIDLKSIQKGTVGSFNYNLMVNGAGRIMAFVELGHNTNLHLIATGDVSRVDTSVRTALANKWLVPVELEGDFPDYFKVYASPDKQIEVREVFDPTNMANFVDFCRDYDFEIFDDEIYISQGSSSGSPLATTPLIATIENFLQKNSQLLTTFLK